MCGCRCGCGCVCVHLRKKEDEESKATKFVVYGEEREKKVQTEINKITNAHATVTVHICTVIVAIVHKCTIMHKLVWGCFFCSNCVKVVSYSILHNYAQTDVIALIVHRVNNFFILYFSLSSLHLTLFSFLSPLTVTVHSVKKKNILFE